MLGEDVAHVGRRAVLVVGEHLDDDGHAARAVALVKDGLEVGAALFAGAAFDGAVDVVFGHAVRARLFDGRRQRGVGRGVGAALFGGHHDGAGQL